MPRRILACLAFLSLFLLTSCGDVAWQYFRCERTRQSDGSVEIKLSFYNLGAESQEARVQARAWEMLSDVVQNLRPAMSKVLDRLDPGARFTGGRYWVDNGSMNLEFQVRFPADPTSHKRFEHMDDRLKPLEGVRGAQNASLALVMLIGAVTPDKGDPRKLVHEVTSSAQIVNTNGRQMNLGEGKRVISWDRDEKYILFTLKQAAPPAVSFAARGFETWGLSRNL